VYVAEDDRGVLWRDPTIGIQWPIATPVLSEKDQRLEPLDATRTDLPQYKP
jgi:dTDP-4-dehydrorhamnose 3,5-epimerase